MANETGVLGPDVDGVVRRPGPGGTEAAWRGVAAAASVRLRDALPVLATYAAIRIVGFGLMALMAPGLKIKRHPQTLASLTGSWDADWYRRIAVHGYDLSLHAHPGQWLMSTSYAWFPGYPATIDLLRIVPGVSPSAAGLAVTLLAGLAAAWGVQALGVELTGDRRTGLLMAALWAVAPGALTLQMAYSEALFCAVAVWALVALARRRWLTAGLLACLSGTVRSTAVAVIGAVVIAVAVDLVRRRRQTTDRGGWWRPLAAVAIAPLGFLGYLGFVAWETRRLDGWFMIERGVGTHFDWGAYAWHRVEQALLNRNGAVWMLVTLTVVAAIVLWLWTFAERVPLFLRGYLTVVLATALGAYGYYQCRPRFLMPAFLLALPLALLLRGVPNRVLIPLFGVLAAASTWFGLYVIAISNLAM